MSHYPNPKHFCIGSALSYRKETEECGGIYFRWQVMSYFLVRLLTPVFWMPDFLDEQFFMDPEEFTQANLLPFGVAARVKQHSPIVANVPFIGILQINWIIEYLGWQDYISSDALLTESYTQDIKFRCHVPPEFSEFRPRHDASVWEREREGRKWLEEAKRRGIQVKARMGADYQILPKFR